jgi:hypothetical protein
LRVGPLPSPAAPAPQRCTARAGRVGRLDETPTWIRPRPDRPHRGPSRLVWMGRPFQGRRSRISRRGVATKRRRERWIRRPAGGGGGVHSPSLRNPSLRAWCAEASTGLLGLSRGREEARAGSAMSSRLSPRATLGREGPRPVEACALRAASCAEGWKHEVQSVGGYRCVRACLRRTSPGRGVGAGVSERPELRGRGGPRLACARRLGRELVRGREGVACPGTGDQNRRD